MICQEVKKYKYIFGPVPSRRLGRSLGVDIIPFKTCSYDCIYCQLGKTTNKSIQRMKYSTVSDVLEEIRAKLKESPAPDFITLSGSGEPTLHSSIGDIISGIKEITPIPVAVITNGSLLWMPEVRRAVSGADVVLPSLDAGDKEMFQKINQPHIGIAFEKMLKGLKLFRKEYKGQIWLEVFLVRGVNDSESEVLKIATLMKDIRPDRIQFNTVARPAADRSVRAVPMERLKKLAEIAGAEVISGYRKSHTTHKKVSKGSEVLAIIGRHPCSIEDIQEGLQITHDRAEKYLAELLREKSIIAKDVEGRIFYSMNVFKDT